MWFAFILSVRMEWISSGTIVYFENETGCITVEGNGSMLDYYDIPGWYELSNSILSVAFVDGVTRVGACAFKNCRSLISILFAESITEIGAESFMYCTQLPNITFPNKLKTIAKDSFDRCGFKGDLTIPDSVTGIGDYAFALCSGLSGKLKLSTNLLSIGSSCFNFCGFSGPLIIPNGVQIIGSSSFGNNRFSSIILHSHVSRINEYAFLLNSNLIFIRFLGTQCSVDSKAFVDCINIKEVLVRPIYEADFFGSVSIQVLKILDENGDILKPTSIESVFPTPIKSILPTPNDSISPTTPQENTHKENGLSSGTITGIVIGTIFFIGIIVTIVVYNFLIKDYEDE